MNRGKHLKPIENSCSFMLNSNLKFTKELGAILELMILSLRNYGKNKLENSVMIR